MRKRRISIIIAVLSCWTSLFSQEIIFPGMTGDELLENLQINYKPGSVLTSSQAKDTLYAIIQNNQDTVQCVYSGHYLILPDGVDPSQWLFMNGETPGLNLEHVYPVSKGATQGTPANNDMHHLFPTRVKVNSDRGSLPFGEISDEETLRWYYLTTVMSSMPTSQINLYSEWDNAFFEPREDFKGDVARAVLYFFTMYREQALNADPDFFELQRQTLLEWHILDPVDVKEMSRNDLVAIYQDNKVNPYITDPSLAMRAFCVDGETCMTTGMKDLNLQSRQIEVRIVNDRLFFEIKEDLHEKIDISIYDLSGRLHSVSELEVFGAGKYKVQFNTNAPDIVLIHLAGEDWSWRKILPTRL